MKSVLRTIAVFITTSIGIHANATADTDTFFINGIEYCIPENCNYAEVKSCDKELEEVIIPETVKHDEKEYPVASIGTQAFYNCMLTSVTIPSSVNAINSWAFYGCEALRSVSVPSSVTDIGEGAFWNCSSLESINLSSSIIDIKRGTFYGCKSLTSVEIPASVIIIGEKAFEKCLNLNSVEISPSATIIEESAFQDCYSLSSVTIPSSVITIGKAAFSNCNSMTSVTIPSSVTTIGVSAFYGCDDLKSLTIPSSVTEIGESAFWNCTSLESATISSSVTDISRGTFYGCKSLTSVVIPSSVETIGEKAFEQCMFLPFVIIPSSVNSIGENAFQNCESLTTIVSLPTVPPAIGHNAFYRVPTEAIVYIPAGTLEEYPAAGGWTAFHDFRELGTLTLTISSPQLNLRVNETTTLTVSIEKAYDVTIESETWTTSNPDVATVDDGVVTAVGEGSATISYTLIDGTGCPHVVSCEIFVDGYAAIEEISDYETHDIPVEYYNLNGVRIDQDNLTRGIYIKKQGKKTTKILVK